MLVGAVFTGVIQSSAASVGVLQALAMTGAISYGMAIPVSYTHLDVYKRQTVTIFAFLSGFSLMFTLLVVVT